MKHQRIQLRRAKGWRKPAGAVVVSRPTKWGNPHRLERFCFCPQGPEPSPCDAYGTRRGCQWLPRREREWQERAVAVTRFREDLVAGRLGVSLIEVQRDLRGKVLACWCPADLPCHADVLLREANR
jgi:hypothetical protein